MGIELLLPLAIQYAPWISKMIFGGAGEQTTSVILDAAKKVFGTTDEAVIKKQIAENDNKAKMFVAELESHKNSLEAALRDTQNARTQTVDLAKSGSSIAWGAPIVSIIVAVGFISLLILMFLGSATFSGPAVTIATMLVGTLTAGFSQVINYWLGSSSGSRQKDILLANSIPDTAVQAVAERRPVLQRTN